jgi:hypothetical protein
MQRKEYLKEYYKKNAQKIKEATSQYKKLNSGKTKIRNREWALKNKEKINERQRRRYKESPKKREAGKKWRMANREKSSKSSMNWYRNSIDRVKHNQRIYKLRSFNLSLEDFNNLFQKQNGNCGICEKNQSLFKTKFAIDHDHKTGKVRGLLCASCNIGLGMMKDDKDILLKAIKYLSV